MAYRGFRSIRSASGDGATLAFHLVDGVADLPAVASQGVGNFAFGLVGADEGKTWQVRKLTSGLEWHEVGGGIPAGDITVTGDLQVDGGATVDGDATVGTLSVTSGGVTLKPGAKRAQIALATFTAPHDFVLPDDNGTFLVRNPTTGATTVAARLTLNTRRDGAAGLFEVINDGSGDFGADITANGVVTGSRGIKGFVGTVVQVLLLASPSVGLEAYATNGCAIGQSTGAGTGVKACWNGSAWTIADGSTLTA